MSGQTPGKKTDKRSSYSSEEVKKKPAAKKPAPKKRKTQKPKK
jgi:hypothetical protein